MEVCRKCGSKIWPGVRSCPACGAATGFSDKQPAQGEKPGSGGMAGSLDRFDSADIAQNRAMAVFAYLGILVIFPLFMAKGSRFARYHAGQGLALLLASAAYSIAYSVLTGLLLSVSWEFYFVLRLIRLAGLAFPALAVLGIMNAINGKAAELPVIGKIRLLR